MHWSNYWLFQKLGFRVAANTDRNGGTSIWRAHSEWD